MTRWWCIEVQRAGHRAAFVGRVECTRQEILDHLGPHVIVCDNGLVTVYGRPT